jgi:ferredoxin
LEPVELSLSEAEAKRQAMRCLRCDVCIRCGICERLCREKVKVEAFEFKPIGHSEQILFDYERPAKRCITCGACALACPTQAIQIVDTPSGNREMQFCGIILNSLQLVTCELCGNNFAPQRYMEYVTAKIPKEAQHPRLCAHCTRSSRAKAFAGPFFSAFSE